MRLLALFLFVPMSCLGRTMEIRLLENEVGQIGVKYGVSTLLIFEQEVELMDLGSAALVNAQVSKGQKEVLLKPTTQDFGFLSNLNIKAGPRVYTFRIVSSNDPPFVVRILGQSVAAQESINIARLPQPVLENHYGSFGFQRSHRGNFVLIEPRSQDLYLEFPLIRPLGNLEQSFMVGRDENNKWAPLRIIKVYVYEDRKRVGVLIRPIRKDSFVIQIPDLRRKKFQEFVREPR